MPSKTKWTLVGVASVFITLSTAAILAIDLPQKIDPLVVTQAEAQVMHVELRSEFVAEIDKVEDEVENVENVQAVFNAYTLRMILNQEIEVLKLKIKSEKDPDRLQELKDELSAKQRYVRQLEEEERRRFTAKGDLG